MMVNIWNNKIHATNQIYHFISRDEQALNIFQAQH